MALDLATAYDNVRNRIAELTRSLDESELATPVPACPGWSVRDVVAHLTGVCVDIQEGTMPTPENNWTEVQVGSRRQATMPEVLGEWDSRASGLTTKLEGLKGLGHIMVADVTLHELDIRNALGRTDGRDTVEAGLALATMTRALGMRITQNQLPALRLVAGDQEIVVGDGERGATVRASHFELLRAAGGRRTQDEIRALDWDGDPTPYVALFSPFPFPEASLDER